ncbi:MAG: RNA polymerase sigma factor [Bacteroidales bacterium]|nr:RNA polymerase sigma factor [Bacteroidales bacterium]
MATLGSRPINELIRLAMIGDGAAFTELWDTHIAQLKSYVKGWLKQLDDFYVDDICSRSFEKAFRQISAYDPAKSQFYTWLRTIARNTALDMLEQESRLRNKYVSLDDNAGNTASLENMGDDEETPLESIIKTEDREVTGKYISGLPELYREVARKRLLDGLQYKEIAEELDMELNTVRTRIRRAKSLIDKMKEDDI